ncbi:hypothetical protein [Elioraea tepidiphila]|uniref:hypothetical protein n=1 Tax=Elioraea tepidiphila TaxID=457934 RepID=UPI002FDA064F
MRQQKTTWIVLGADGRHVLLGRHREPDAEDLERVSAGLRDAGQEGWLALLYGDYWGTRGVRLDVLRPLTPGAPADSSLAVAAFLDRRMQALSQLSG